MHGVSALVEDLHVGLQDRVEGRRQQAAVPAPLVTSAEQQQPISYAQEMGVRTSPGNLTFRPLFRSPSSRLPSPELTQPRFQEAIEKVILRGNGSCGKEVTMPQSKVLTLGLCLRPPWAPPTLGSHLPPHPSVQSSTCPREILITP